MAPNRAAIVNAKLRRDVLPPFSHSWRTDVTKLYSSKCPEKLFGKSEWAPLLGSMGRKKRAVKHPYRRSAIPKTRDPGSSSYFPNSSGRYILRSSYSLSPTPMSVLDSDLLASSQNYFP